VDADEANPDGQNPEATVAGAAFGVPDDWRVEFFDIPSFSAVEGGRQEAHISGLLVGAWEHQHGSGVRSCCCCMARRASFRCCAIS
jgi:hypothetical protein